MPHLIDDDASGTSASIIARSSPCIGRRGPRRFAKNDSMGRPRSARGPGPGFAADFFGAALPAAAAFLAGDFTPAGFIAVAWRGRAGVITPPRCHGVRARRDT